MTAQHLVQPRRDLLPPTWRPHPVRGDSGPAAALLGLQRLAGNDAVTRYLAGGTPGPTVSRFAAVVQRCGPTPCNCSSEERADYAASHPGEQSQGPDADDAARPAAPAAD